MNFIKLNYEKSKEVVLYKEIEEEIRQLKIFIVKEYNKRKCFAIHHTQVHPHSYNFFIVHPSYCLGEEPLFEDNVIINPKIIEFVQIEKPPFKESGMDNQEAYDKIPTPPLTRMVKEACMSFPFRESKNVERAYMIRVEYQDEKMNKIKKELYGEAAQIFQHECDHANGKNIYYSA